MSTPDFDLFPSLVPELRLIIWDLCLPPSRLIPMSQLALAHQHNDPRYPPLAPATRARIRKALTQWTPIAAVCREARAVALSHRRPLDTLGIDWLQGIAEHGYFDPRFDTILVDCDVLFHYKELWRDLCATLRCGETGGVGIALRHQAVEFPVPNEGEDQNGSEVAQGDDLPILMEDFVLHQLTDEQAVRIGCFGLFGEARFAVFDLISDAGSERMVKVIEWYNGNGYMKEYLESFDKELEKFKGLKERLVKYGKWVRRGAGNEAAASASGLRPYPAFVVRRDYY